MARRKGGDVYVDKKKNISSEIQNLPTGLVAQRVAQFTKEGRVLKGGKTRRMRGRGWRDYLPSWIPGSTAAEPQPQIIGARRRRLTRRR
jgi:hypothetical protein